MRFGLKDETIKKITSVFAKYSEIDEVIIYGSRSKGNYRVGSDIDITMFGKELNESIRSRIINEIDDLNTPYLFDISIFSELHSPDLQDHITRIGQVFYKKEV